MQINLNNYEKKVIKKLTYTQKNSSRKNILSTKKVYVVNVKTKAKDELLSLNDDVKTNLISQEKYKIGEDIYDSLDEIKQNLKENIFDNIVNKDEYKVLNGHVFLDNQNEIFIDFATNKKDCQRLSKEISGMFLLVDNFTTFKGFKKFLVDNFFTQDIILKDFPADFSLYSCYREEYIPVPYAILLSEKDAEKIKNKLLKNGFDAYVETVDTSDKENDFNAFKQLIKHLYSELSKEV